MKINKKNAMGTVTINIPTASVKFTADLSSEADFDRAINLLIDEKERTFPKRNREGVTKIDGSNEEYVFSNFAASY